LEKILTDRRSEESGEKQIKIQSVVVKLKTKKLSES